MLIVIQWGHGVFSELTKKESYRREDVYTDRWMDTDTGDDCYKDRGQQGGDRKTHSETEVKKNKEKQKISRATQNFTEHLQNKILLFLKFLLYLFSSMVLTTTITFNHI